MSAKCKYRSHEFNSCAARGFCSGENIECVAYEPDIETIGAVCSGCAYELGFLPKDKQVGVWMGECEVCHKEKPCTDLWHDWRKVEK